MSRKAKPSAKATLEHRIGRSMPPNFMFPAVPARVLDDIVPASRRPKVVGIVAPVGYGKTVFMSTLFSRLQSQGEQCFWAALDDRDSTIQRVLLLLEEMVYRHSEQLHPTQALFRGDDPVDRRIDRLVQAASSHPVPFTAFLDNLDNCADEAVGHLLDRLVFETPSSVHFVFSSKEELPLNLVRAKLEGLIRQIGYTELSFTDSDVAQLLGPELSAAIGADGVETVTRQTEGWPAAVRLVQIVLAATNDPQAELERFSGANEDLAALLNRQVLSGFPAEVREFLFCIAHLRAFSADLCRHASSCEKAGQYLDQLLRRNVFVIPLDHNRTWYRLHALFREYLLREAQRSLSAARRLEVLTRAAEWCEQSGYWRDAIEYALAANADETATGILERNAANLVRDRGDLLQYIFWIETLKKRGRPLGWESEYWYIWALVLLRRYKEGRQQVQRLTQHIERSQNAANDSEQLRELHRRIEITKVCLDIFSDRIAEAHRSAALWLDGAAADDDPFDTTSAHLTQGVYFSSAFLFPEAREAAHAAQISAFQIRSSYVNGWIIALNALPSILEGNYALIQPELTAALASLRASLGESAGIVGTVALLGASCAVEMGRYDEARILLAQGMRTSRVHGVVDAVACGLDAAVKLWRGEPGDPVSITDLRAIADSYSPRAAFMLSCFLVRRLLRLGRLEDAQTEAARIGLHIDAPTALPKSATVARSRDAFLAAAIELCIAGGQARQVEPLIAEETRRARADGRGARLVELALAETDIAVQKGNPAAGNRHLMRSVTLAATRGIIRPFDDHAATVATLVEDTKPTAWGFALAQERRFFSEICCRLPIRNRSLQEKLSTLNVESRLLDPLTKRQLELLGLLEAGLSNQQIADRINVSLTTVKGHLQKLYAKFNVSNRSAALAQARVLNLL